MKCIILIGAIFGLCYGEAPVFGGAPYPASGWKPDGASFKLPTEYGAPVQQPHASEIEITQENVVYAGMLGETTTVATPSNTYLPPDNDVTTTELPEEQPEDQTDFITVQGLPKPQAAQYQVRADFRLPQRQQQFRQQPQQQQFRQQPQQQFRQQQQQVRSNLRQAPQQSQFRGNLRQAPQPQQQQQGFNQRPNEFAEFIPQNQAAPVNRQFSPSGRLQAPQRQQQNFNYRPQQQFGRLELTPPATSYGVPQTQYGPPQQEAVLPPTTTVNPAEDSGEDESQEPQEPPQEGQTEDYDESNEGGPVVAISNASDNASRGQYYILAPDNTLQKVVFMTSQTEEDRRNNGFSAQLKYSPVTPIRDPIYAYNEQGQLVRIYRKK